MVGLGSIPALLALPWVLVMVVYGIQSGLLGNSYPMGMVMLAAVVGMFVRFVFLPFVVLLKWGAGALGRAKKILFWVLLFDVLAIPVVMLIVKIATPKVYDRESLALVAMEAPEVDVSGIWVGEWTDPGKEMTSKITLTLTQTGGSVIVLDDNTAVAPTFVAPANRTILTFTLTVTDSYGLAGIPDEVIVTVQQPEIIIAKQANTPTANVDDAIFYTYTITNTGDVALSQVNAVVDRLGLLFAEPTTLAVGQMISQTLTYTIVEADLPGPLVNTVVISGTDSLGNVAVDSDFAVVTLTNQPDIVVLKEVNMNNAGMGAVLTYTYTVLNAGDVTLRGITATDKYIAQRVNPNPSVYCFNAMNSAIGIIPQAIQIK